MEPSEGLLRGLLAAAPDALLAVNGAGEIVFLIAPGTEPRAGLARASS